MTRVPGMIRAAGVSARTVRFGLLNATGLLRSGQSRRPRFPQPSQAMSQGCSDDDTRACPATPPSEREPLLQAIIETSPDALITIDEHSVIQIFNPAAERIFGYRADEVIGRNVNCLMPPPFKDEHDDYVRRYLTTGEKRIIGIGREVQGLRKDGSVFPMELAVGEVRLHNRRLFAGFVRDVSARRQAQERLHELQAELLHVSRLSEMGEMASSLAHELNQPLTAIINYLQACRKLLAAETDVKRIEPLIDKVIGQASRAGQIIQNLRKFITRGETHRSLEPINAIVQEAAALALIGAREKGIEVSFDLAPELPAVLIDRIQIDQVITNLVRNSVDAVAEGDRRQIVLRTRPAGAAAVEVAVEDSGPGLPEQVVEHLFEPFVTTKPGGIGIGLSICRTIVDAHDGRLWATPNPEGGTIFHLVLPIASEAGADHAA